MPLENLIIPDAIRSILTALSTGLNQIKPNGIEGLYLTGSIVLDDFYLHKSDIDFLVLTTEPSTQQEINQLDQLHERIQKVYPKPVLNGVYLTRHNLQVSHLATDQVIHFQDGRLHPAVFEMGPIALYELKTVAHTLRGTPAQQLPINIGLADVKNFMHLNVNSYWRNWLNRHSSLTNRKGLLVLFPGLTEWGVLGVARQLYTLKQGTIVSKKAAGYACLDELPADYHPVLEKALHTRMNTPSWANSSLKNIASLHPSWQRANRTIDCMHYLIEAYNTIYLDQQQS